LSGGFFVLLVVLFRHICYNANPGIMMQAESNRVEYKQELNDKLERSVVAFLNYREGGQIYIGTENGTDDGASGTDGTGNGTDGTGSGTDGIESGTDDAEDDTDSPENHGRILEAIGNNPHITLDAIAEITAISRRTVTREIKKMQELGLLKRVGSARTGHWETSKAGK
jgi:predicted HTH transcriptional regulator